MKLCDTNTKNVIDKDADKISDIKQEDYLLSSFAIGKDLSYKDLLKRKALLNKQKD
jgi:hypothetical protein